MNNPYDSTTHDVRLHDDGSIVEDLAIDSVSEGDRDQNKNLLQEGGVLFRTPKGKPFFMKFSEFSFILNRRVT